jgi:hypothetical protein
MRRVSAQAARKNIAVGNFGVAAEIMEGFLSACENTGVEVPDAQRQQASAMIESCEAKGRTNQTTIQGGGGEGGGGVAFDLATALAGERRVLLAEADSALGGEWARGLAGLL